MAKQPLFLQRKSYRARRLMDVVRLLPLIGLALWMIPLFWPLPGPDMEAQTVDAMSTSLALQYIFGVWVGLVMLAWLLGRATTRTVDQAKSDGVD
ncbi:MAG: hypothetical protein AAF307_02935 [Pseudomonadota bacterium]